jgi:hypothetical protein
MKIVLTAFMMPNPLLSQCLVSVDGTVVNELGDPLPGAKLSLVEDKVYIHQQLTKKYFQADSTGHFTAEESISSPGTYWIMAMKPDEGYPDNRLSFYLDREPPRVALECGQPRSGIVVRLGPKVAYVRQLTIIDAQTGLPVENAGITLRRVSRPVEWTSLDALFLKRAVQGKTLDLNLAVPSEVDISYEITAPGYDTSPRAILHLKPLQNLNLEVMLQRTSQSTTQSP